jgi:two-component system sensor histidine kinase KdpD
MPVQPAPAGQSARADDFLELVERSRRGRLKLYIGMATGVGKTYRMLEEAHALKKRGVDVVLGFVETHGRPDTQALTVGLEAVPRASFEYRGVTVEEMDLKAVLARKPQVAIVDELAHTNPPLCTNTKRYGDVLEILAAGINVISALNVQHLESLNPLIENVTGVKVRETVPDRVLRQADQVVNVDLPVEDLLERLRSGKVYKAEKIPHAMQHFFTEENLRSLRELALREVAERVEHAGSTAETQAGRQVSGKVMVCISSASHRAKQLLHRRARLAGRLNTDWYVVYVETPQESALNIDAETQRHLLDNTNKACELGAQLVKLHGADPVETLLHFARTHGVAHVLIGRPVLPWWQHLFKRSLFYRMVEKADDVDLHIVSIAREERP